MGTAKSVATTLAAAVATAPAEYVDDRELERRTPISRAQWQRYRYIGGGPPYRKLGRRCVYKWSDVVGWIDAQSAEAKAAP